MAVFNKTKGPCLSQSSITARNPVSISQDEKGSLYTCHSEKLPRETKCVKQGSCPRDHIHLFKWKKNPCFSSLYGSVKLNSLTQPNLFTAHTISDTSCVDCSVCTLDRVLGLYVVD